MSDYVATIETNVAAALAQWRTWIAAGGVATLFQTPGWLSAWYATLGAQEGRTPLLACIARREDGRPLLALPLSINHRSRPVRIEWADLGVADYAAPLVLPGCPEDAASLRRMFSALRRVLPAADLWVFEKMPAMVGEYRNPLLQLRGVRASVLFGNPLTIGEDFDGWRYSREKTHRKELERSWRVFTRVPGASFQCIRDPLQAQRVMDALEQHQRRAIAADKGWSYILDQSVYRDFYRSLLDEGLATGEVVLTALIAGDEVVAALLGLRGGAGYAMIRIGSASGEWRNCSPGRLIIERTIGALHEEGVRHFDFTIGDYAYKRGFMPDRLALFDLTMALSWRGWPQVLRDSFIAHLRAWLTKHPALHRRAKELKTSCGRLSKAVRRRT